MTNKRKYVDPDFGEIELGPPPTREDVADVERRLGRLMDESKRLWPDGVVSRCPVCKKKKLVGRSDLVVSVPKVGRVDRFMRLRGGRCENCSAQVLEPWEQAIIERAEALAPHGDYEVKVSNIGRGTVGTYWPKDVTRVLGLDSDTKGVVKILDDHTMVVVFDKPKKRRKKDSS